MIGQPVFFYFVRLCKFRSISVKTAYLLCMLSDYAL
uniref:Uncharacterized protein n=1 Tax=Arundo donax TaxID=35708 RepID=A0A0A8Z6H8_ARUDO